MFGYESWVLGGMGEGGFELVGKIEFDNDWVYCL